MNEFSKKHFCLKLLILIFYLFYFNKLFSVLNQKVCAKTKNTYSVNKNYSNNNNYVKKFNNIYNYKKNFKTCKKINSIKKYFNNLNELTPDSSVEIQNLNDFELGKIFYSNLNNQVQEGYFVFSNWFFEKYFKNNFDLNNLSFKITDNFNNSYKFINKNLLNNKEFCNHKCVDLKLSSLNLNSKSNLTNQKITIFKKNNLNKNFNIQISKNFKFSQNRNYVVSFFYYDYNKNIFKNYINFKINAIKLNNKNLNKLMFQNQNQILNKIASNITVKHTDVLNYLVNDPAFNIHKIPISKLQPEFFMSCQEVFEKFVSFKKNSKPLFSLIFKNFINLRNPNRLSQTFTIEFCPALIYKICKKKFDINKISFELIDSNGSIYRIKNIAHKKNYRSIFTINAPTDSAYITTHIKLYKKQNTFDDVIFIDKNFKLLHKENYTLRLFYDATCSKTKKEKTILTTTTKAIDCTLNKLNLNGGNFSNINNFRHLTYFNNKYYENLGVTVGPFLAKNNCRKRKIKFNF